MFSEEEHCAIYLGKTRYFKAVVTVLVSIQDHTWLSWPQHSGLQRPESNVCFCIFCNLIRCHLSLLNKRKTCRGKTSSNALQEQHHFPFGLRKINPLVTPVPVVQAGDWQQGCGRQQTSRFHSEGASNSLECAANGLPLPTTENYRNFIIINCTWL